jgi:hypothetical protein
VEHVADNIGGANVQLAAMDAKLAVGESTSDACYQTDDESEDEALSRRHNGEDVVWNLMQRRVHARLHWFWLSSHLVAKSICWLGVCGLCYLVAYYRVFCFG